ncbi:unnamed protein product [Discula destructiva]
MGKRPSRGADANSRKRQKFVHEAPTSEEIQNTRQLLQLVVFDQDLQKARHGLQSFKVFLDGLLSEQGASDDQSQILKDYLEIAKRQDAESETTYLPDIMETWAYAAHTNNDNIMSAVVVVLALLLKFTSQRLDLTAVGLGIGRTLLQKRQQELLARNLAADKSKEFIISPTLRLLREVLCYDGGTLAKSVFRARNLTFKALARNMGIRYLGEGFEDAKRPSARTNAVRLFLSALKFLHAEAKVELLSQNELPLALTKSLRDDPPYLIIELFDNLRNYVLKDDKLPGQVKGKMLSSMTLSRFASLYHYEHDNSQDTSKVTVEDAVHAFLMVACTSSTGGVLRPQSGYYPRHIDPDDVSLPSADEVEPGLENITWMEQFRDDVPVRNVVLADFVKCLKPHSSPKHSELLLAIFGVAPELVTKYFIDRKFFNFEPKLSATWIGYSAFLHNVIELPIPAYFGRKNGYAHVPPPTSIIIDNIIPLPMSQKALVKCLTQKEELIPFVVMRLLVVAMQKLQIALKFHREAAKSQNRSMWDESARRLVDEFCQRAPSVKDIIACYRAVGDSDLLQREAASRLLRLYYDVVPQVALMAKFDVSPLLFSAIKALDGGQESDEDRGLRLVELENLLAISGYSPGMRWFFKPQGLPVSPFVSLLKVYVAAPAGVSLDGLRSALGSVAEEHQLIHSSIDTLMPLLETLQSIKEFSHVTSSDALWMLLDNSASRCATAPIKYLEMLQDLSNSSSSDAEQGNRLISPFAAALVEQLPFAIKSADDEELSVLAQFVAIYIEHLRGEKKGDAKFHELLERIEAAFAGKPAGAKLLKKYRKKSSASRELRSWGADFSIGKKEDTNADGQEKNDETTMSQDTLTELLFAPPPSDKDNSALSKWATKEPDELVEEGYAASVVSLLASEHISIRKEALTSISKMAVKINESTYEEKEQVWLLLSELVESCKPQVDMGPVPNTIVSFARHALAVLRDPHHALYGKINAFLIKGPTWKLDRMPLVYDILQEGPELDDTFYTELSWIFPYLLDGLLTEADMATYHNTRLFERLLALMGSPYMRQNLRAQCLKIIYRATCIAGGSTTLITRFGIVSWLEAQSAAHGADPGGDVYKALLKKIWATSDQDRVAAWSKDGVADLLHRI